MKVLITGATGMVGMSLQKALRTHNHWQLICPNRQALNLLHPKAVVDYLQHHQPDMVIHLAARVGGIQANLLNQTEFLSENILINTHVIEGARLSGVRSLLYIASSCMYPKNYDLLSESDLLCGSLEPTNEGYAFAKIGGTLLCKYIHTQYGLNYKTIVPCNLYGPYDHFDLMKSHLIPAMIYKIYHAMLNKQTEVTIWGEGTARREFMYVDDLATFIILAMNHITSLPPIINVGLGYDYSVNEYYHMGATILGFQGNFKHDLTKPSGMQRKLLNIELANQLGWRAQTTLQAGLQKTYEYFLENIAKKPLTSEHCLL